MRRSATLPSMSRFGCYATAPWRGEYHRYLTFFFTARHLKTATAATRHSGPPRWTDADRRGDPSAGACLLRCAASKGERYMTIAATHIPLGHSGLKVTPFCADDDVRRQTDEAEAGRIVAAARDGGVNGIDMPDPYAKGESERIAGRLIARDRERWVLASKVANPASEDPNAARPVATLVAAGRRSQPRRARHRLDRPVGHAPRRRRTLLLLEETLSTMARLIELGKIRYYSARRTSAPRVARLAEITQASARPDPADRLPADLQRDDARHRNRTAAVLCALRHRRGGRQPTGARRRPTAKYRRR